MIHPKKALDALKNSGISFFTGVPDSLFKDFLQYLEKNVDIENHITASNEGGAIALATGHHISTKGMACVYMQNSGLGNALNPLVSLADKEVYSIPMLLLIGWRGEPGVSDEPQHIKQGKITEALLDVLSIPYTILSSNMLEQEIVSEISRLSKLSQKQKSPCAVLIKSGIFETCKTKYSDTAYTLKREDVIEMVLDSLDGDEILISTTGKISRELYEVRKKRGESHDRDFLTVGSMGHASQIALGIAHSKKDTNVYCLDGDGSFIMHMGSLATTGWVAPHNFKHIILNNCSYESVGGQPTAAGVLDMSCIAKGSNYSFVSSVDNKENLINVLHTFKTQKGPAFLEIKVGLESRKDLGRPTENPVDNKEKLMKSIE